MSEKEQKIVSTVLKIICTERSSCIWSCLSQDLREGDQFKMTEILSCDEKFSEYDMEKKGYVNTEPQRQSQELRNRQCC